MSPEEKALFDNAAFFDCSEDNEELSSEDIYVAIETHFDNNWTEGQTREQQAEELCPITVYAFQRKKLDPAWLAGQVDRMLEGFIENFDEEYGSPDYDENPPWDIETGKGYNKAILNMLTKATKRSTVWQCDKVASREYTKEECLEMLGE